MKQPLDQLIQRFERIVQQLKDLEVVFSSTAETCSYRTLVHWKSMIKMEADALNSNLSEQFSDRLFQADEDSSKE